MKKLIVLAWLFLVGVACSSDDNKPIEKPFEPRRLEATNIIYDVYFNQFRSNSRENRVIKNDEAWEAFKEEFHRQQHSIVREALERASIDFSQDMVVAVIDDIGGGITSIDIVEVTEHDDQVVVNIDRLYYGIAAVITQAYHIVKVPKINKPTVFMELFDIHF